MILLPAATKSHGQSLQEAINQAQKSRQEARDRGQSRWKPNMTDSLCRKRKLADSFTPCGHCGWSERLCYDAEDHGFESQFGLTG